jgi:nicotinamidase-related amidase
MKRALLVIDIQKDYFPGGKMELVGTEAASLRARELLDGFRKNGEELIHVQHIFQAPNAPFFVAGTEGVEIHPNVKPLPGERLLVKHHANAFKDTPLQQWLRERGVTDVVICGMMTSMCVDAATRAAADLGFNTYVAADACAAPDLRSGSELIPGRTVHNAFLAALGSLVARVESTSELLSRRG